MNTWTCHAKPARLGGRTCGHINQGEPFMARAFMKTIECCKGCGCTKKASDDRQHRAQHEREQHEAFEESRVTRR